MRFATHFQLRTSTPCSKTTGPERISAHMLNAIQLDLLYNCSDELVSPNRYHTHRIEEVSLCASSKNVFSYNPQMIINLILFSLSQAKCWNAAFTIISLFQTIFRVCIPFQIFNGGFNQASPLLLHFLPCTVDNWLRIVDELGKWNWRSIFWHTKDIWLSSSQKLLWLSHNKLATSWSG